MSHTESRSRAELSTILKNHAVSNKISPFEAGVIENFAAMWPGNFLIYVPPGNENLESSDYFNEYLRVQARALDDWMYIYLKNGKEKDIQGKVIRKVVFIGKLEKVSCMLMVLLHNRDPHEKITDEKEKKRQQAIQMLVNGLNGITNLVRVNLADEFVFLSTKTGHAHTHNTHTDSMHGLLARLRER